MSDIIQTTSDLFSPTCNALFSKYLQRNSTICIIFWISNAYTISCYLRKIKIPHRLFGFPRGIFDVLCVI